MPVRLAVFGEVQFVGESAHQLRTAIELRASVRIGELSRECAFRWIVITDSV